MTQRLVQLLTERQDYETPPELVAALSAEFGPFEIDFAATEANKKAPRCFTPEQDSLSLDWSGVGFLNPPYGKMTGPFVKKASEANAKVVCLLPARTDTRWFHDHVLPKRPAQAWPRPLGSKETQPFIDLDHESGCSTGLGGRIGGNPGPCDCQARGG